jgi:hypothetical protein
VVSERGRFTPTMKVKRMIINQKYSKEIVSLYPPE